MKLRADVTVKIPDLGKLIPPEVRRAALQRAGVLAISRIRARTEKGQDVDGQRFVPYSAGYARLRAGSGRSTEPTLHLTGAMLASMKILEIDDKRVLIGFTGSGPALDFRRIRTAKGKATSRKKGEGRVTHAATKGEARVSNALKAAVNNRTRRFFALSTEDRFLIAQEIARALKL